MGEDILPEMEVMEGAEHCTNMGLRLLACLFHLPTAVIYGSLSLFVSILHNVFLLYYVDTFVSVYKIDKLSFWIGEVRFFSISFCAL